MPRARDVTQRRGGLRSWLKGAFSMDAYQEPLTDRERQMLDRIAQATVRRGMTVPALLFLEISKPLNYIGSQAMAFFEPMVKSLFTTPEYSELRRILERRESVEVLMRLIEDASAEKTVAQTNSAGSAAAPSDLETEDDTD